MKLKCISGTMYVHRYKIESLGLTAIPLDGFKLCSVIIGGRGLLELGSYCTLDRQRSSYNGRDPT
jgi:hypothetical protein